MKSRPTPQAVKAMLAWGRAPIGRRALRAELAREGPVMLEVGSTRERPGWTTSDVSWRAGRYLDVTKPWPVPRGSVQFIYADNVIEHLTLEDSRRFFRNAVTALTSDGVLRLATPDLEVLVNLYLHPDSPVAASIRRWHTKAGRLCETPPDFIRLYYCSWGHSTGFLFDYRTLSRELMDAGFSHVERVATGQSREERLRNLESRLDEEEEVQLVVEARRE